ncbi:MAG: ABC transporter permease [Pyrinomonadaceae bacterium]
MLSRLIRGLRALFRRSMVEGELDEELRFHLEKEIEQNIERGMGHEDARRAALLSFGRVEQVKEECREVRGTRFIEELWQDVRYGVRMLVKKPGFTVVALLALCLGVGANTAIFSMVNAVLLRQLPFKNPDRLVWIWSVRQDSDSRPFTLPEFIDYRDQNQTLDQLAAFTTWNANLTDTGDPVRIQGTRVSANLFQLLGVEAVMGRTLLPEDDKPGHQHVVVLSYGLWQRQFGADANVIGKTLTLNGDTYTVVGVLPPQHFFPVREAELGIPLAPEADSLRNVRTSVSFLRFVGRLKPDVTQQQAEDEFNRINSQLRAQYPVAYAGKAGVRFVPLFEEVVGGFRRALWVLFGAVAVVMLIACANLANLLLVRAASRQKEIAIRTALGATRWRVIRQLLTESLILALVGGVLGLILAAWGVDLLLALVPTDLPRVAEVGLDARVLGFTCALSLLAGLTFGLAPAWQTTRIDLNAELKAEGRGSTGGPSRNRLRRLFVMMEVALSLVLLIGAGLFIKSFLRLQEVQPGFDTRNILVARLSLPKSYGTRDNVSALIDQLTPRLSGLPGVKSVGAVSLLPLGGSFASIPFTIIGQPPARDEASPSAEYRVATPDYFRTMGIPLLAGRVFSDNDTAKTQLVVLINGAMARRYWPHETPVGAHIRIDDNDSGPREAEIVGVVGDVKHSSLENASTSEVYLPFHQIHEDNIALVRNNQFWVMRTDGDPLLLANSVRREIQAINHDIPASNMRSMEEYLAASIAPRRFNLLLLSVFAATALLLSVSGLYGVMAYTVSQRTQEIGLRLAIGARPVNILKLMMGEGLKLALVGVATGLVAAFFCARLLSHLLFNVETTDLGTFICVPLLLIAIALLATLIPAWKASKVDPLIAMRHD